MNASGEPITKCPVCRYDLTGLPKNYTCPECGFEYDESMRVWPCYYRPRWLWILVLFVALVLIRQVTKAVQFGSLFGSGMEFNIGTGLFILAIWLGQLLFFRPVTFVAMGKNGITYKCPFGSVRFIPWDQISFPDRTRLPRRLEGNRSRRIFLPVGMLHPEVRGFIFRSIRSRVN